MRVLRNREQPAVEAWLRRELSGQYDAALREPVPDELLRLVAAVAERS